MGVVAAINNLASCYLDGKIVAKDSEKAVKLYERAIDCGHIKAI